MNVIAIHGDIERAHGDFLRLDSGHDLGESTGEEHSAGRDAKENEPGATALRLDNFVTNTGQRPVDVGLGEDDTRHVTAPFRLTGRF